jgi:hypothetical protein
MHSTSSNQATKEVLKMAKSKSKCVKKNIFRFWQPGRQHLNSENPRLELCWIVRLLSLGVYLHWNLLSFLSNFVGPVVQFQIYSGIINVLQTFFFKFIEKYLAFLFIYFMFP